jgi:hypothetical protein
MIFIQTTNKIIAKVIQYGFDNQQPFKEFARAFFRNIRF